MHAEKSILFSELAVLVLLLCLIKEGNFFSTYQSKLEGRLPFFVTMNEGSNRPPPLCDPPRSKMKGIGASLFLKLDADFRGMLAKILKSCKKTEKRIPLITFIKL